MWMEKNDSGDGWMIIEISWLGNAPLESTDTYVLDALEQILLQDDISLTYCGEKVQGLDGFLSYKVIVKNLTRLNLYSTDLSWEDFSRLEKTESLTLRYVSWVDFEMLAQIENLKSLSIFDPRWKMNTSSASRFDNLEKLDLSGTIDYVINLENDVFPKLTDLTLELRHSKIWETIRGLTSLKKLDILCPIEIPKEIENLIWLTKLSLSNVKNVPKEVWNLKNLRDLTLDQVTEKIPSGLTALKNLEVLNLFGLNVSLMIDDIKAFEENPVQEMNFEYLDKGN